MHPSEVLAAGLIAAVGLLSLVLMGIGLRAWRASGNRKLLAVALAFGLFFVKEMVTAVGLLHHRIGHEHLELIGALFDAGVIALLVAPFLMRD